MIRISRNSNLIYLPIMYFLPQELIIKCPTLRKLPRKIREIMQSEKHRNTVERDQFLNEIMDATAALAFRHFGFSGWKEHYTGNCPVWKLSYSLPLWAKFLESEIGWNLQALYNIPSAMEIPFFDTDYINETISKVVKWAISEQNWQPLLDVVKKIPCEEDFEKWNTNAYKMFRRKWYHTRYYEKRDIKVVSYEACKEEVHQIRDSSTCFEETVESREYIERFKSLLSPKDKEIITLRAHGYTYEKISEMLGYKNHSGVIKKVKHIKKIFEKFEETQNL